MKLDIRTLRRLIKEEVENLKEASDLTKDVLPKLENISEDLADVKKLASDNKMPPGDIGKILAAQRDIDSLIKKIKRKSK